MSLGLNLFGFSPLWTTVPICLAILVASRMRAGYWLRETYTWRSRLIPLIPLFCVMVVILVAVPFVRIYSVPSISWEEVDAYFDKANMPDVRRDPVKRKALLQYMVKHNDVPPEYRDVYVQLREKADVNFEVCTYEEYLLLLCQGVRSLDEFRMYNYVIWNRWGVNFASYLPWERARTERRLRLHLVAALAERGYLRDVQATRIRQWCDYQHYRCMLDYDLWWFMTSRHGRLGDRNLCGQTINRTTLAVERWYKEHDNTFPPSLNEMVESGYLKELPKHPYTSERMQYHRNAPAPQEVSRDNYFQNGRSIDYRFIGGRLSNTDNQKAAYETFQRSGGTYLSLGGRYLLFVEPERAAEE
jgi:hypothetical protein